MKTKVFHVTVQFTFPIDATSVEAAKEITQTQLEEWIMALDTDALYEAARDAEIKEI